MKSMQVQLKILENKINSNHDNVSDFLEHTVKNEIADIQSNTSQDENQKKSSLEILVILYKAYKMCRRK